MTNDDEQTILLGSTFPDMSAAQPQRDVRLTMTTVFRVPVRAGNSILNGPSVNISENVVAASERSVFKSGLTDTVDGLRISAGTKINARRRVADYK